MQSKTVLVSASALILMAQQVQFGAAFAEVHTVLPEHLLAKYNIIDPTKQYREIPRIEPHLFVPRARDTLRSKTEDDIPRIPEHKIDSETIPDSEFNRVEEHDYQALAEHRKIFSLDLARNKVKQPKVASNLDTPTNGSAHQFILDQMK